MPLMTWLPKQKEGSLCSDETPQTRRSGVWRELSNKSMNHDKQEARVARLLLAGYAQRWAN